MYMEVQCGYGISEPIYPAWCEGASGADTVPVPGADLGSIPDLAFAARLHHPQPGLR